MHLPAPSRRALGLAAVGAIAASTTVFTLGGVAAAAPADALEPLYYSTYESDTGFTVPGGYCTVNWELQGADGGRGWLEGDLVVDPTTGAGSLEVTTGVTAGQVFTFGMGETGTDGDSTGGGAGGAGTPAGAAGTDLLVDHDDDALTPDVVAGGGGGGGGAAAVSGPSGSLVAHGGDGADVTRGGAGGGENTVTWPGAVVVSNGTLQYGGSSYVAAQVLPCIAAPLAPSGVDVVAGNGTLDVHFVPEWNDAPNSSQPDTWEYRVGDGAWTPVATTQAEYSAARTFSLTGLTNGTSYAVQVRGISEEGLQGEASSAVSGVPFAPVGAPGGVQVSTTPTAVTVTWTAPTVEGTFPVAGYGVGMGAGEMGGEVCQTEADVLACVITGVQSGMDYSVVVYAFDSEGNMGEASEFVMTGAIPFPTSAPTSHGSLATSGFSAGSVTAGAEITVSGTGYAPFSTVTVLVYSSPTVLGTAVADANGAFTFTGKLPVGLAPGSHTLVAAGVDDQGNPRYLTMPVTVGGAAGGNGAGGLAYTGADIAVPAIAGLAALTLGGGLVVAGKRRRVAAG